MDSPLDREGSVDREYHSAMECHHVLGDDAFQNETSRDLFNAIDELKSCGASRDIQSLPEIVIVGDQSVGKSSLLQSLTDIPFPIATKLCTRFPTRIVSRRDAKERTKVSIEKHVSDILEQPEPKTACEARLVRQSRYPDFEESFLKFSAADFSSVVEKASQFMNITGTSLPETSAEGTHNFSRDTLKIEIQGPRRSHFAILDLPGNFQSLTGGLLERDMKTVREMVLQHMEHRQSIIVCVASGPTDLANQGVFDMAAEKDPEGDRTIGVITKCDVTQEKSEVVEIVKNETKPLRHGWFVVRNRTPREVTDGVSTQEHHRNEHDFFCNDPWNVIPEERRGTQALKKQLANLLCARIERIFPSILKDIQEQQNSTTISLRSLGTPRPTVGQKRAYLSDVALEFHSLILQGIQGQYSSLVEDAMKLRMQVRKANDDFARVMKQKGHSVPFMEQPTSVDKQTSLLQEPKKDNGGTNKPTAGFSTFGQVTKGNVCPSCPPTRGVLLPITSLATREGSNLSVFQSMCFTESYRNFSFEEIRLKDSMQDQKSSATSNAESISPFAVGGGGSFGHIQSSTQGASRSSLFSTPSSQTKSAPFGGSPFSKPQESMEIYRWIRSEIAACRGTELQGTLNPSVLPILFHRQAQSWRMEAQMHFARVMSSATSAVYSVLKTVCQDIGVRTNIEKLIQEAIERQAQRRSKDLAEHVDNLLTKHLQTSNEAFAEKVKAARMMRFHSALDRYRKSREYTRADGSFGINEDFQGDQLKIDMRDIGALFNELHISNQQNLEDEIHDILKAYYEIARENFVEFVNNNIIESYLYDKEGPVYFFSPVYVGGLTDEQVENIAAEEKLLVRNRAEKEAALIRLSKAEKIAEKCIRPK